MRNDKRVRRTAWTTFALTVAVTCALVLVSCRPSRAPTQTAAPTSVPATPTKAPALPALKPADRIAAARDFASDPDLAITEGPLQPRAFGSAQVYEGTTSTGDRVRIEVDIKSGTVTSYARLGTLAYEIAIDLEQAQATALAFAQEHYDEFNTTDLVLARAELVDHGPESPKAYSFWWVERDHESGAYLPNEVKIRVNPQTSQVDTYSCSRVEVVVSTHPQVTEQNAREIALGAAQGLEGAEVVDASLAVSTLPVYEPNGEQALLWRAVVAGAPDETGYTPGAFVFVHAQSGDLVHIEPFR